MFHFNDKVSALRCVFMVSYYCLLSKTKKQKTSYEVLNYKYSSKSYSVHFGLDFCESLSPEVREQCLMTNILPCVKVRFH